MGKLVTGLPSLIGVILGIWLYSRDSLDGLIIVFGILVILQFILLLGKTLMSRYPVYSMLLIETWVLSSIVVVAICTLVILWFTTISTLHLSIPKEEIEIVSGVFIGALTTYFASVWTNDIAEGEGFFWPTRHFKNSVSKFRFKCRDCKYYDSAHLDRVRENGPKGWGLVARWKRSKLLEQYLTVHE